MNGRMGTQRNSGAPASRGAADGLYLVRVGRSDPRHTETPALIR
jgi:hypothetical protein